MRLRGLYFGLHQLLSRLAALLLVELRIILRTMHLVHLVGCHICK